jgi:hypothetical protein
MLPLQKYISLVWNLLQGPQDFLIFIIIEAEICWSGRKSKPRYALFNPKPVAFEVSCMLK